MIFLALLAIPALIALCFFAIGAVTGNAHKITPQEFFVHFPGCPREGYSGPAPTEQEQLYPDV
jgi:hypothetical protein